MLFGVFFDDKPVPSKWELLKSELPATRADLRRIGLTPPQACLIARQNGRPMRLVYRGRFQSPIYTFQEERK